MKLLVLLFTFILTNSGYEKATISTTTASTITVKGTSTMHDWEMTSSEIIANGELRYNDSNVIIDSFNGYLEATTLKSHSKQMDKNAYKTMKADEFNRIEFQFKSIKTQDEKESKVVAVFAVTIAGVTKDLTVDASVQPNGNDDITISGSHKMNMSDFDIKPPSFMLGTLKVGDELAIDFNLNVKISKNDSL